MPSIDSKGPLSNILLEQADSLIQEVFKTVRNKLDENKFSYVSLTIVHGKIFNLLTLGGEIHTSETSTLIATVNKIMEEDPRLKGRINYCFVPKDNVNSYIVPSLLLND